MTKRNWLWLEDRHETVADFRVPIEREASPRRFTSPLDLMTYLVEARRGSDGVISKIGLILDVMLIGQPFLMAPAEWHGVGSKISYHATQRNGYDAGLVFVEKLVLPNPGMPVSPLTPPPPIIFLTVSQLDFDDIRSRFENIRLTWATSANCSPEEARVEWVRKWNGRGARVAELLRTWEN